MQVEITGIEDPLKKNAELNLDWKKIDISGLSQAYLEQRLVKSEALIHEALEPFGYYNAKVKSQLQQHKDQWLAHYTVAPGPVTTVENLNIQFAGEGQQDPALLTAAAKFPLLPEMPLIHSQYESGKSAINKQLHRIRLFRRLAQQEQSHGRQGPQPRQHCAAMANRQGLPFWQSNDTHRPY